MTANYTKYRSQIGKHDIIEYKHHTYYRDGSNGTKVYYRCTDVSSNCRARGSLDTVTDLFTTNAKAHSHYPKMKDGQTRALEDGDRSNARIPNKRGDMRGRQIAQWRKKYFDRVTVADADQEPNPYRRHLNICRLCGPSSKGLADAPTLLRNHMRSIHAIDVGFRADTNDDSDSEQDLFSDHTNSDVTSEANTNNGVDIVIDNIDHISVDGNDADDGEVSGVTAAISDATSAAAASNDMDPESTESLQTEPRLLSPTAMSQAEHSQRMRTMRLEQEKLLLEIDILNAKKRLLLQKMSQSSINITL